MKILLPCTLLLHSCFLSQIGTLIGTFLVPIFLILVINVVIFIWVITVVIRHAREKAARTDKAMNKKQILRMTISISGVLFLFGLSRLFFVFTFSVSGLRETFQILFTVFNSLQGFFVFAFILFTEGFDYIGRPCCHVRSTKPSILLMEQMFLQRNKAPILVPYRNKKRIHLKPHIIY